MSTTETAANENVARAGYVLDAQVGFILRQVHQRHAAIFASHAMDDLTPTQWAALAKLRETGACSQNLLGRLTAMDVATVKGVIERLTKRGYVDTAPDPTDGRRVLLTLSPAGVDAYERVVDQARAITQDTLAPLKPKQQATLLALLDRLR
jgi:MarR family transcriptional regulator, lower aerobic nicotinate degradation pathway regulator